MNIEEIELKHGNHRSREAGMCAMEAAAYLAGEPHSDHPQCVSKTIAAFMRSWNDSLNDTHRQRLKPYVVKSLDTAGTAAEKAIRGTVELLDRMIALTPKLEATTA